MYVVLFITILIHVNNAKDTNVLMTEVFEIVVDPPMFNWTYDYEDTKEQYVYQASLLNAPDLPSWINFVYSDRHHSGYLYGVPPQKNKAIIPLEIIALNKKNYETRIQNLNIIVDEKLNPARYEVHLKIDNLNVEDMFDVERMEALKHIFRKQLWKDSEEDLYVTFLGSAVELGARKPLNPSEREGVVVRLGSEAPFPKVLTALQKEVKPLWKVPSCPRDFKRTSVERIFRDAGFALDWCSFRLLQLDHKNSAMHQSGYSGKLSLENLYDDHWQSVSKSDLPQRSYVHELLVSILVPMFIMIVLASILSFILCFHQDEITRHIDDIPSEDIDQFATIQKATESLRNFSNNREMGMSPDPILIPRSHTNSPTSTISRGVHCRPSPPPYIRPKFKPEL